MSSQLLPRNATRLERSVADTAQLDQIGVPIDTLWDPERCALPLLPWLAWALSVDEWDESWSEQTQRSVILASIEVHRRKGTVGAVRRAIDALGYQTTLIEWWQQTPRGIPHTFFADVEIDDRGIDDSAYASISRQIEATKPARSHYTLRLVAVMPCPARAAIATLAGDLVEVLPYSATEVIAGPSEGPRHAVAYQDWIITEIFPQ